MGHRLLKRGSPIWDSELGNMVEMRFKSASSKTKDVYQLDRDEVKGGLGAYRKEGEGRAKSCECELGWFAWSTVGSIDRL